MITVIGISPAASASPQAAAPRQSTYQGLWGVAFFTALLVGIVVVKRLPKSWHQPRWSRRLLNRL